MNHLSEAHPLTIQAALSRFVLAIICLLFIKPSGYAQQAPSPVLDSIPAPGAGKFEASVNGRSDPAARELDQLRLQLKQAQAQIDEVRAQAQAQIEELR